MWTSTRLALAASLALLLACGDKDEAGEPTDTGASSSSDGGDGADGTGGADGSDGTDGIDGTDGSDGADGEDGTDGTAGTDADGDGYVAVSDGGDDCDDSDPDVNPGAAEVCDESDVDEDCNGLADDLDSGATGQVTVHVDTDGDGWGGAEAGQRCDAASGQVLTAGDCDDDSALLNLDDADSDGYSTCDGDCDDSASSTVPGDCYQTFQGGFEIDTGCSYRMSGLADLSSGLCPDCEHRFAGTAYHERGAGCEGSFPGYWGVDLDDYTLVLYEDNDGDGVPSLVGEFSFYLSYFGFYDAAYWYGTSDAGAYYGGAFFLYR